MRVWQLNVFEGKLMRVCRLRSCKSRLDLMFPMAAGRDR